MAGLTLFCPFCGGKAVIRTSSRPSILTVQAKVNCSNCGQLKAEFVGQLTNIQRAVFVEAPEVSQWEKTEKELIKEGKIKAQSNAERLNALKGEQQDLFEPKPEMSVAERVARRKSVQHH